MLLSEGTLPYTDDYDLDAEETASDDVTVGSMPTQLESSMWTGVRHRGVFDMFQRQGTMIGSRAEQVDDGASAPRPSGPDVDGVPPAPPSAQCYLRQSANGTCYPLAGGVVCTVGRGRDCYVRLVDDEHLSRRHAAITCVDDGVVLVDLGSANGTWVAGRRLERGAQAKLAYGQPFYLSKNEFTVLREA